MNLPRFTRALTVLACALAFGAAAHAQSPTLNIASPNFTSTTSSQVTVTILASANGGATFAGSTGNSATISAINFSGGTINGGPANGSASLPFSGFGTPTIVVSTVVNLGPGTYQINASVTDSNGLTSTAKTTFKVTNGGSGISTSTTPYTVTFNPVTEIANGTLPYILTTQGTSIPGYFLQITGPNDPNSQDYPFNVTYQVAVLSNPAANTKAQALSYIALDSFNTATGTDNNDGQTSAQNDNNGASVTVQFTQPSQLITLHIQETMTGPTAVPGDFLYQISGTWISSNGAVVSGSLGGTAGHITPGNAYIVEWGAGNTAGEPTINSYVTAPQTTSAPVAVIKVPPTAETEYIYPDTLDPEQYPTSATVNPIIIEGDYTSSNSPVTSVNIYWGTQSNPTELQLNNSVYDQDTSYSSYSLTSGVLSVSTTSNVGDAVAASSGPEISDPGLYTISATASSNGNTSPTVSQLVDVVATLSPGVAINSPADGSTIAIPYPGSTATPAFNVVGNASAVIDYYHGDSTVNIGEVDYNLYDSNGNEISGFNGSAVPGSGDAFFNGWISNSLNIPAPTSTGHLPTLAPGTYTLIVTVSNVAGSQTAISTFTVAQVPEPTVTLTLNPGSSQVSATGNGGGVTGDGSTAFNIAAGQSSVTVPYIASGAFLGTGTLDATFTSAAVTSTAAGFISPTIATGAATFTTSGTSITFTAPGTYFITAQDGNSSGSLDPNGTTATATITVVVTGEPNPYITLTAGPSGSTVSAMGVGAGVTGTATLSVVIPAGSPSVSVPYSVAGGVTGLLGSDLTSAVVTASNNLLNFLAPLLLSAPTPSILANSTISFTAPGTYTLNASDSNTGLLGLLLGATANATITFNVQEVATPSVSLSATAPGSTAVTATGTGGPNPTTVTNTVNVTLPASGGSVTVPYTASGKVSPTGSGVIDGVITSAGVTSTLSGFSGPGITTGNSSFTTSGTGITFTAPGSYSLTVSDSNVSGSNNYGSSASTTLTFNVTQASVPSVALAIGGVIATGTGSTSVPANLTVTIPAGQNNINVTYTATGSIAVGSVDPTLTSASVTSNAAGFTAPSISGIPGAGFTTSGASITFSSTGIYTLTATDSNSAGSGDTNGVTASATVNITVKQVATPSVTIAYSPTGTGSQTSNVTSTGGSTAATATLSVVIPANLTSITIPYTASGKLGTGTVDASLTSASVSLTPTVSGFTAPIIGVPVASFSTTSTSIIFNGPGTYTLTATDSNSAGSSDTNGVSVTTSLKITVTQVAAPTVALSVGSGATVSGMGGGSTGSGSIILQIPAGQSSITVPYTASFGISGSGTDSVLTSAGVASTAPNFTAPAVAIPTGSPTPSFSTSGQSLTFNSAGSYSVTVKASNSSGSGDSNGTTAAATYAITVQQTPSPTVKLVATPSGASPVTASGTGGTPGSATVNVVIPAGQTSANVPYTASGAISGTGSVDALLTSASVSASSNLSGFAVPTISGLPSTTFSTNGTSVSFTAGGSYSVTATDSNVSGATDTNGTSATAALNFVVQQVATPTVTLTISPAGATPATAMGTGGGSAGAATISIQIPAGQPSLTVPYTASGAIGTGQIDTTLTSASVTSGLSGFTAPTISGVPGTGFTTSGTSITFTAPGTYTLTAQDSNVSGTSDTNGVKATTTITITVTASGCTPPTQTESSSFTKSTLPAGDTLWLASVVNVSGLGTQGGTVQFASGTVSFKANGATVTLPVPASTLIFSPSATSANTSYNAGTNTWQTIVPAGYTGNVFVAGVAYQASSSLSVSSGSIAWSGGYDSSTQNVSVQWSTSATLYSSFNASLNALGIKPVDSSTLSVYTSSDLAGTAEAYSSSSLGAVATVGGGSGTTAISGLYPTGVSSSGSLLASSASNWSYVPVADPHYTVTASSAGSRYTGAAVVAPTPLASGWVTNTSLAQWIYAPGGSNGGNGGGNNYLPASGSTALTDTYDYTLTFTLPAGTVSSGVIIGGTISADDSVQILVNGIPVTSNVPTTSDYLYNTTASFTLNGSNASFQAGSNTITFRVANENTPTPANASGLFVQTISGTVSTNPAVAAAYCSTLSTQAGSPPTVAATSPAAGSSYTIASSGGSVSVPVAFSATSPSGSGNITSISATLNGQAVSLSGTTGVGTSATAAGTATLSIGTAGSYTLNYSGTNAYGSATTSVAFTVNQILPPSIAITAPTDGSTITMTSGATTASVPYSINGSGNGAVITAATATITGSTITGSFTGLNTNSISKSGTLSLSAGTYTLAASDTNSAGTTSAHITFSVVNSSGCGQGTNTGSEVLVWLQTNSCSSNSYSCNQNNSCKQTVTGGTIVPVTFAVYGSSHGWSDNWNGCWDNQCNSGDFVVDTSVVISVTEINSSGTSSPAIYTYGASGPNPPYYSISNGQYVLNLPTDSGNNQYEIEVYHPLSTTGTQLALLGSENLYTSGNCLPATTSISANFNGTAIATGNGIWFNSVVHVSGDSSNEEATLWFDSATVSFTIPGSGRNSSGTDVTLSLPAAAIKFDPNATTASTVYNAAVGCWVTVVPAGYNGNVFLTGLFYQVPSGFPSGLSGVTFSGNFRSDDNTIGVQWQWAAAVYKSYPTNPASIGVKPVDSNSLSSYSNSDHAGTPEAYKSYDTGGAMGGGASNYTGSYSGTATASIGASSSCWQSSSLCNTGNWNSGWSSNWCGSWNYNW